MATKVTNNDKKEVLRIVRKYRNTRSVQEKIKLADALEQKVTEIKTR